MGQDPYAQWLQGQVQSMQQQLQTNQQQQLNQHAAGMRKMLDSRLQMVDQRLSDLATVAGALSTMRSGASPGGIVRVEDIPGRRIPFTLVLDIPIASNTTSIQTQSVTISQEGPFVAVSRMATFMSSYQYQVNYGPGNIGSFSGRTNGRYRPVSSCWDILDGQSQTYVQLANPLTTNGTPGVSTLPNAQTSIRSMEFDGRINVRNAGSSWPRSNNSVPTSFWSTSINAPVPLGCLDFFERGEVVTASVECNHINNPPAGNVDGLGIYGVVGWPFENGQFDAQEGILTPGAFTWPSGVLTTLSTDVVTRLPDGVLTIAWEGYRIQQPISPVP